MRFQNSQKKFKINAKNATESARHRENVLKSFYDKTDHNAKFDRGEVTYRKELNAFSHLSFKEFTAAKLGLKTLKSTRGLQTPTACQTRRIPESFNWAESGVVTPVQDQGNCGCCWVFGSVAAVESAIAIKYGKLIKLSEQELLECVTDPTNLGYGGCRGGNENWVYNHLKNVGGVTMNYNYRYSADDRITCSNSRQKIVESKVVDYVTLTRGDEQNLKYHLATVGPITVEIFVAQSFRDYTSDIYIANSTDCPGQGEVNHLVLLVGYGSAPCNGLVSCDYWILKNSWGE